MPSRLGRRLVILATAAMLGCTPPPASSPIPVIVQQGLRFQVDRRPDLAPVPSPSAAAGESPAPQASDVPATTGPGLSGSATPGPAASPAPATSSGGRGGGAEPASPAGVVWGIGEAGPAPVPVQGAEVWTTDGRRAVTDADGRFALEGAWPANDTWMVRHPRYRTSTIVGVGPQADLKLHVKTDRAGAAVLTPNGSTQYDVTGRLIDGAGAGAAGLSVGLQAPDGSFGPLVTSGADGAFTMRVFAHGPTVANATFVAVDRTGQAAMAVSRAVTLSQEAPEIDFDPATPDVVDALRVVSTDRELEVVVDDRGLGGTTNVFVEVHLPTGEAITVFANNPIFKLGAIPGARYGVQAELAVEGTARYSVFRQDDVALVAGGRTTLTAAMLRPPVLVTPAGATGPLEPTIAWQPDAEARGTEVQLNDPLGHGFQWEGFTAGSTIPFSPGDGVSIPPGEYRLRLVAWNADGMMPRQVASLDRTPYRVLPLGATYRYAVSERRLAL